MDWLGPDYNSYFGEAWGWPNEVIGGPFCASNIVVGCNPPYSAADFLAVYPKFGGTPTNLTGDLTQGSNVVANVSSLTGLAVGQLVIGVGVVGGSTITAVGSTTITLSANAVTTGTTVSIAVYVTPLVPMAVLNTYIFLASASLVQARWLDSWTVGMSLFVAHYLTLWLMAQSGDGTAGATAAAGLALGIKTAKAVGDVSVSYAVLDGLQDWGAWQLTSYGQLLATMGACIGMGPVLVY